MTTFTTLAQLMDYVNTRREEKRKCSEQHRKRIERANIRSEINLKSYPTKITDWYLDEFGNRTRLVYSGR